MSEIDPTREAMRRVATMSEDRTASIVERAVARAASEGLADVAVTTHDSPIGALALAATEPGVVAVSFDPLDALMERLSEEISPRIVEVAGPLDTTRQQLDEYFAGTRTSFDLALDWRLASGFRLEILHELVQVGFGETVSYQDLARRAGRPKASRAVGTAMATNPIPIIVPCHRVLRTGGALGGYAGGLDAKRLLLTLEGVLRT